MPSHDESALADLNEAAADLLLLYERLGVRAIFLTLLEAELIVRCQVADDVVPLCKMVLKQYEAPEGRVLN